MMVSGFQRAMVAALAAALWCEPPAVGQSKGAPDKDIIHEFEVVFEPPINGADIDTIVRVMGFGKEQAEAARLLFEGFDEKYQVQLKVARKARDRMLAARREKAANLPQLRTAFDESRDKLRELKWVGEPALIADIKTLATARQFEQWPVVERFRRRENMLYRVVGVSPTYWCKVNMLRFVERVELSEAEAAAVGPRLAEYEMEIDAALVAWNAAKKIINSVRPGDVPDEVQQHLAMVESDAAAIRAAGVNRRAAKDITAILPPAKAAKLSDAVRRYAYPAIYRELERPAEGLLGAAQRLGGLSDEQREEISAVAAVYERDSVALDRRMEREYDEVETRLEAVNYEERQRLYLEERYWDKLEKTAAETRGALEDATIEGLRGVLTEGQRKRVGMKDEKKDAGRK